MMLKRRSFPDQLRYWEKNGFALTGKQKKAVLAFLRLCDDVVMVSPFPAGMVTIIADADAGQFAVTIARDGKADIQGQEEPLVT